ncbi:transmembrane emp24 domain-containing protein 7-like protein [Anopheles sinensis]|uniref:Transmembrane emp24 domain-containing protein 7-like protein n=1 Tax=Anopheles sinensis TaxID=74873 RepID=A0A084VMN9_ANOSI|nr:transmembrane emp24 domain-containing protein 7-like protein [Anopheles sinensis]
MNILFTTERRLLHNEITGGHGHVWCTLHSEAKGAFNSLRFLAGRQSDSRFCGTR